MRRYDFVAANDRFRYVGVIGLCLAKDTEKLGDMTDSETINDEEASVRRGDCFSSNLPHRCN